MSTDACTCHRERPQNCNYIPHRTDVPAEKFVDVVIDGAPGPFPGRFVEVEDETGASINFGEWVKREDGYWALRIPRGASRDA